MLNGELRAIGSALETMTAKYQNAWSRTLNMHQYVMSALSMPWTAKMLIHKYFGKAVWWLAETDKQRIATQCDAYHIECFEVSSVGKSLDHEDWRAATEGTRCRMQHAVIFSKRSYAKCKETLVGRVVSTPFGYENWNVWHETRPHPKQMATRQGYGIVFSCHHPCQFRVRWCFEHVSVSEVTLLSELWLPYANLYVNFFHQRSGDDIFTYIVYCSKHMLYISIFHMLQHEC